MGFMKPPKISMPAAQPATMQEPPVRVENIEDGAAADYNALSRRRKGILSTILSNKDRVSSSPEKPATEGDRSELRKTLG